MGRIWRQQTVMTTRNPYLLLPSSQQGMSRWRWSRQEMRSADSPWTPTVPSGKWNRRSRRRLVLPGISVSPSRSREGSDNYSAASGPWQIMGSSHRWLSGCWRPSLVRSRSSWRTLVAIASLTPSTLVILLVTWKKRLKRLEDLAWKIRY